MAKNKRKNKLRNWFLIVVGILLVFFIFYNQILQQQFASEDWDCGYVDPQDPSRDYGCLWGGERIHDKEDGRIQYLKVYFDDSVVEDYNEGKIRIKNASFHDGYITTYNSHIKPRLDVHSTSNNWNPDDITWSNQPGKTSKIGVASRAKGVRPSQRPEWHKYTQYSDNFNENLAEHIRNNFEKEESEASFVISQSSIDRNIYTTGNPKIELEIEEAEKYYNIEDNSCEEVFLFSDEVGEEDYEDLEKCRENIVKEDYFKYNEEKDICEEVEEYPYNTDGRYYDSLNECMDEEPVGIFTKNFFQRYWIIISIGLVLVLLISLIIKGILKNKR